MSRFAPADLDELRDAIGEALAVEEPLDVLAGGSKRGLGRPLQLPRMLDLSRLAGIRDYQPSELVLTAGAATPIEEIDAALAEAGQMLAFEPPDFGALFGLPATIAGRRTLGGALACNLSGPRRIKAGAARDHFLGFRGVSGRGEAFKAGGKVVKNVTGYDLCKLMAGSFGTLAALEEVTVKVLPQPETLSTVMLWGLDASAAVRILSRALASPHDVSGAVYLPAPSTIGLMSLSGSASVAALRLVPAAQEQVDLLVAADERRAGRAQRLEPVLHRARTHHLVCLHPISEALRLDATEILVLEQPGQEPASCWANNHGAGCCGRLQARGEIRCLADDRLFLRGAHANEIADHH